MTFGSWARRRMGLSWTARSPSWTHGSPRTLRCSIIFWRHCFTSAACGGLVRQVVQFVGVAGEVEELLLAGVLEVDVFVAVVHQGHPAILGGVTGGVLQVQQLAARLAAQDVQQAHTLDGGRARQAGGVEEGGEDIAQFGQLLPHLPAAWPCRPRLAGQRTIMGTFTEPS